MDWLTWFCVDIDVSIAVDSKGGEEGDDDKGDGGDKLEDDDEDAGDTKGDEDADNEGEIDEYEGEDESNKSIFFGLTDSHNGKGGREVVDDDDVWGIDGRRLLNRDEFNIWTWKEEPGSGGKLSSGTNISQSSGPSLKDNCKQGWWVCWLNDWILDWFPCEGWYCWCCWW